MLKSRIHIDTQSFFITPTLAGIDLFVWAHGRGEDGVQEFLNVDLVKKDELNIQLKQLARFKSPEEENQRAKF